MAGQTVDLNSIKLGDIMKTYVYTVSADSPAGEAARVMLLNNIHGLCVTEPDDNSRIRFVVTSFDILGMTYFGRFSEDTEYIQDTTIEKLVKDQKLVKFTPDQTVKDALDVIAEKNIRTLPIVEGEKLVGIVSIFDLVQVILSGGGKIML